MPHFQTSPFDHYWLVNAILSMVKENTPRGWILHPIMATLSLSQNIYSKLRVFRGENIPPKGHSDLNFVWCFWWLNHFNQLQSLMTNPTEMAGSTSKVSNQRLLACENWFVASTSHRRWCCSLGQRGSSTYLYWVKIHGMVAGHQGFEWFWLASTCHVERKARTIL